MTSRGTPVPRRPRPARLDWEDRGHTRADYLWFYVEHPPFREALLALYANHAAGRETVLASRPEVWRIWELVWRETAEAEWAKTYLDAVHALAVAWGLDRLGPAPPRLDEKPNPSEGETYLHSWCAFSALDDLQRGAAPTPDSFLSQAGLGGSRPDIGEVVSRDEVIVAEDADTRTRWVVVDERRRPLVRVQIEDEWDARMEPQPAARERLLNEATRQINAELERIAGMTEAVGYRFPGTRGKAADHLRWLFERVALKKSVKDIAREHLGGWFKAPTVRKALTHYAELVGVEI